MTLHDHKIKVLPSDMAPYAVERYELPNLLVFNLYSSIKNLVLGPS